MNEEDLSARQQSAADLPAAVLAYCSANQLIDLRRPLVVAVSGGADSVALLLLLKRLYPQLDMTVAHYNHRWRGAAADADEAFVKDLATRLKLPFAVGRAGQDFSETGQSEAAARADRYHFLRQVAADLKQSQVSAGRSTGAQERVPIALAHHREDRAETVLLNLLRGSAMRGLVGMRPRQHDLVRPLLNTSAVDLKNYLTEQGQSWRHDETNDRAANKRNALRLELLPFLNRYSHGNITDRLLATADSAAVDDAYLDEVATDFFEKHARPDLFLPCQNLNARAPGSSFIKKANSPRPASNCASAAPIGFHFPLEKVAALPAAILRRLIRKVYCRLKGEAVDLTSDHILTCEQNIYTVAAHHNEQRRPATGTRLFNLRSGVFYSWHRADLFFGKSVPDTYGLAWLSSYNCNWDKQLLPIAPKAADLPLLWSGEPTGLRASSSISNSGREESISFQTAFVPIPRKAMPPTGRAEPTTADSLIARVKIDRYKNLQGPVKLHFNNIEKAELLDYNCMLWACFSCSIKKLSGLRCRRPGDTLLFPDGSKRPLKKVLNELSIPQLWRDRILFGTDGLNLYGSLNLNLFGRFTEYIKIIFIKEDTLEGR